MKLVQHEPLQEILQKKFVLLVLIVPFKTVPHFQGTVSEILAKVAIVPDKSTGLLQCLNFSNFVYYLFFLNDLELFDEIFH